MILIANGTSGLILYQQMGEALLASLAWHNPGPAFCFWSCLSLCYISGTSGIFLRLYFELDEGFLFFCCCCYKG